MAAGCGGGGDSCGSLAAGCGGGGGGGLEPNLPPIGGKGGGKGLETGGNENTNSDVVCKRWPASRPKLMLDKVTARRKAVMKDLPQAMA